MSKVIITLIIGLLALAGGRSTEHKDLRTPPPPITATPTAPLETTDTPPPEPQLTATPTLDPLQAAMLTAWSVELTQRAAADATYAAVKATQAARWLTQTAPTATLPAYP